MDQYTGTVKKEVIDKIKMNFKEWNDLHLQKNYTLIFRRRQTKPGPKVSVQPISLRTEDRTQTVHPQLINLSSRSLNEAEKNLLLEGLKFTPTLNESNYRDLTTDIKEYTKK